MKILSIKTIGNFCLSGFTLIVFAGAVSGGAVIRVGAGAAPASIQTPVQQFRFDLGEVNNGSGGSFTSGRREVNWDTVPDNFAEPNALPFDFFNVNSSRGVVFHSIGNIGGTHQFRVSANNGTGTAVRFGNIDTSYSAIFPVFSSQRLFHARFTNEIEVLFFVPGTTIPATVSGFGAVFCDVDSSNTFIEYYDTAGKKLSGSSLNTFNNGLSFIGTSFNAGERVAKVIIRLGNSNLQAGNIDGAGGVDVVALDDLIYGEPRAMQHHAKDFDGDGAADLAVFRPNTGQWFVVNSGLFTPGVDFFGTGGDRPIDGDFDGDQRSDLAVFRPSTGTWFVRNSSNGQFTQTGFGLNGDHPVAGDYDSDGKTDIAIWRPSDGNYYILRSSNSSFTITHWGANGDIPIGTAGQ